MLVTCVSIFCTSLFINNNFKVVIQTNAFLTDHFKGSTLFFPISCVIIPLVLGNFCVPIYKYYTQRHKRTISLGTTQLKCALKLHLICIKKVLSEH